MKAVLLIVSLAVSLTLVGCSLPPSTNASDYVGEYVFTPGMQVPHEFATFLVLTKDHTTIEIRYPNGSGQVSTATEAWHVDHGTGEEVVIGKRAYPIERTRSAVRLIINGDLGQQYEKVR